MTEHWTIWLDEFSPCDEGPAWALQYPTVGAAWRACTNISWLYWLTRNICDAGCNQRAREVFGWISLCDESLNANIAPDYFRSAFPTPTLRDLQDVVACRPRPWVTTPSRKGRL